MYRRRDNDTVYNASWPCTRDIDGTLYGQNDTPLFGLCYGFGGDAYGNPWCVCER